VAEPGLGQAGWMYGEGIVHHTAFQVANFVVQDGVKDGLVGLGFTDVSDRKDRGYFDSVYVRTPGGAMFEATVSKSTASSSTSRTKSWARTSKSLLSSLIAGNIFCPTSSRCSTPEEQLVVREPGEEGSVEAMSENPEGSINLSTGFDQPRCAGSSPWPFRSSTPWSDASSTSFASTGQIARRGKPRSSCSVTSCPCFVVRSRGLASAGPTVPLSPSCLAPCHASAGVRSSSRRRRSSVGTERWSAGVGPTHTGGLDVRPFPTRP
jgi:hypothetical protein